MKRRLSRRDVLKGGAALGASSTFAAFGLGAPPRKRRKRPPKKGGGPRPAEAAEQGIPLPEIAGPGAVPIRLRVNGDFHDLAVEPRSTLLEVLRDRLGLTGTKEVCDRGHCGACTVHLDGKPVQACGVLALTARRRLVLTVENLSRTRNRAEVHPLAASFAAAGALACGFCTPGFLMASKALLDRNPSPTPAEVDAGLAGNLCRCGCYPAIRQAVLEAAPQMAGFEEAEPTPGEGEGIDPGGEPEGEEGGDAFPDEPPPDGPAAGGVLPSRRSLLLGRPLG